MNIESQCVSLELAMKLKELGVEQKSLFYFQNNPYNDGSNCIGLMIVERSSKNNENIIINTDCENENNPKYYAFTAAELMEMLPAYINTKINGPFNYFNLRIEKKSSENIRYIAKYVCDTIPGEEIKNPLYELKSTAKSHDLELANCLAKLLIHLIENKLMDIKDA